MEPGKRLVAGPRLQEWTAGRQGRGCAPLGARRVLYRSTCGRGLGDHPSASRGYLLGASRQGKCRLTPLPAPTGTGVQAADRLLGLGPPEVIPRPGMPGEALTRGIEPGVRPWVWWPHRNHRPFQSPAIDPIRFSPLRRLRPSIASPVAALVFCRRTRRARERKADIFNNDKLAFLEISSRNREPRRGHREDVSGSA